MLSGSDVCLDSARMGLPSEEQLEALAQTALQQINDRSYSAEMQALGIKSIIKYGLAFSGKSARIAAEKQTIA